MLAVSSLAANFAAFSFLLRLALRKLFESHQLIIFVFKNASWSSLRLGLKLIYIVTFCGRDVIRFQHFAVLILISLQGRKTLRRLSVCAGVLGHGSQFFHVSALMIFVKFVGNWSLFLFVILKTEFQLVP